MEITHFYYMEQITGILKKKSHDGKMEWALVGKKQPHRTLKWFGEKKPSDERVAKEEKRVQFFKAKGAPDVMATAKIVAAKLKEREKEGLAEELAFAVLGLEARIAGFSKAVKMVPPCNITGICRLNASKLYHAQPEANQPAESYAPIVTQIAEDVAAEIAENLADTYGETWQLTDEVWQSLFSLSLQFIDGLLEDLNKFGFRV